MSQHLFHHSTWQGYWEPLVQRFKPAWRDGLYRARVTRIQHINPNTIQISLSPEKGWPAHRAGQHVSLAIDVNGRLISRIFTVASGACTHALLNELRFVIRIKDLGSLTPHLRDLAIGQWVNISSPMGSFQLHEDKDVLMIAGGSGITPFIAMLEDYAATHENIGGHKPRYPASSLEPSVHLLYYAKQGEHLMVDELSRLSSVLPSFTFQTLTRAQDGDIKHYLPEYSLRNWMVCGPHALYEQVTHTATANNTSLESEHFIALKPVAFDDANGTQKFLLQHDQKTLHVDNQQSLLSQLQQANIPVNYGCGMGICHQCQCTKKRGIVRDMRTGELSDNAEELIQLCITQAVTNLELQS